MERAKQVTVGELNSLIGVSHLAPAPPLVVKLGVLGGQLANLGSGSLGNPKAGPVCPSSIATNPAETREAPPTPQYPSTLRDTLASSLRSQVEDEGNDFFPGCPEHCPLPVPGEGSPLPSMPRGALDL